MYRKQCFCTVSCKMWEDAGLCFYMFENELLAVTDLHSWTDAIAELVGDCNPWQKTNIVREEIKVRKRKYIDGFWFHDTRPKIKRNLEFRGQPKNPSYNNITVQLHVQMIVQTVVAQVRMRILVCCMFPQNLSTRGRVCVVLKIYVFI